MATTQAEAADQHPNTSPPSPWNHALSRDNLDAPISQFLEVTDVLLQRPQLNSTHLFRADILFDDADKFTTIANESSQNLHNARDASSKIAPRDPPIWPGFTLFRTIVRRLIPRKPQIDRALEQSCFIFHGEGDDGRSGDSVLVVYVPHVDAEVAVPWYHPKVRSLAYMYSRCRTVTATISLMTLSLYYIPFEETTPIPTRLERTFVSLIDTFVRLLKLPSRTSTDHSSAKRNGQTSSTTPHKYVPTLASSLKDSILPQHTVQNTYSTLKQKYASVLIANWTEKTDPAKHVFEDLGIAAFLIELWRGMYWRDGEGNVEGKRRWTGFVDVACGNGVLVWVLCREGWTGWGFDARRRATWGMLEELDMEAEYNGASQRRMEVRLGEKIYVPKIFLDALGTDAEALESDLGISVFDGTLPKGTFIISNHADELSLWTPLVAATAMADHKLPWFAIPCCSHALDGSRKRYTLKDVQRDRDKHKNKHEQSNGAPTQAETDDQSSTGDLKALRAKKLKEQTHSDETSMYSCLTRKLEGVATRVGYEVEMSLVRIPSTRNIGLVGGREGVQVEGEQEENGVGDLVLEVVVEECVATGGVEGSARTWVEKCQKLRAGQGRGKVNWKGPVNGKHGGDELDTTHEG